MAILINKVHHLSKKIATYQIYSLKRQQFFHTNYSLFSQPTFSDKPAWLKKFKLKQAAFQKDDGRPVFLKRGLPDKILYNLTLGMTIFGFFWCFQIMGELNHSPEKE